MFGAFLRGCISYFVHHQYPSNQPTTPPLNKCRAETMFVTPGSFDIPTEWAQDICKKLHAMGYKNQAGLHPEFCVCFGMFLIGKAQYLPIFLALIWGEWISTRQNVFPRHFPWREKAVESQGMPVMPAQTVVVEFRLPGVLLGLPGLGLISVLGRLQFQYWNHFPSRGHRFGVYLYNSRTRAGGD